MSGWLSELLSLGDDEEERMQRRAYEARVHQFQEQREQQEQQVPQAATATLKRRSKHASMETRTTEPQQHHINIEEQEPESRTIADDLEHELDELAAGFMNFVGKAKHFGSTIWESAGDTLRALDQAVTHRDEAEYLLEPHPVRHLTVGVMGSGRNGYQHLAYPLGIWIAKQNYNVLTGGGAGTMEAVSKAFVSVKGRKGRCIGVLRSGPDHKTPRPGYPNPYVEIPIVTHLARSDESADSRNHINILTSDVIVCLPGGVGTRSELLLAVQYGKPVCILTSPDEIGIPNTETMDVPRFTTLREVKGFIRYHERVIHGLSSAKSPSPLSRRAASEGQTIGTSRQRLLETNRLPKQARSEAAALDLSAPEAANVLPTRPRPCRADTCEVLRTSSAPEPQSVPGMVSQQALLDKKCTPASTQVACMQASQIQDQVQPSAPPSEGVEAPTAPQPLLPAIGLQVIDVPNQRSADDVVVVNMPAPAVPNISSPPKFPVHVAEPTPDSQATPQSAPSCAPLLSSSMRPAEGDDAFQKLDDSIMSPVNMQELELALEELEGQYPSL
eukprot:m.181242 g.181242  ORF g.181242 m.181242 type:complete len:558 (-) comp16627_c0_seq1:353-2026(-)